MTLDQRFDDLRAVVPVDEPFPIGDLRDRAQRHRRRRRKLGGVAGVAAVMVVALVGLAVVGARDHRRSALETVDEPNAVESSPGENDFHYPYLMTSDHVPDGIVQREQDASVSFLTLMPDGTVLGSHDLDAPGPVTWLAEYDLFPPAALDETTTPADVDEHFPYISTRAASPADIPSAYRSSWAEGPNTERIDVGGREVLLRDPGSGGLIEAYVVVDGMVVYLNSRAIDRDDVISFIEGLHIEPRP